jgi:hypothetical protein
MSKPPIGDVFAYLDKKPHAGGTIYIVGAGPNGNAGIGRIPADAVTIALNGAIRHKREFSYWLAFDCGIRNYPWWPALVTPQGTRNIFGITLTAEHWGTPEQVSGRIPAHFQFAFRPTLSPQFQVEKQLKRKTTPLIHGVLRGGASIAGVAFQFAAWAGVKKIILCGVDMKGNGHFDGFKNLRMQDAEWPICAKIRWLADSLKQFNKIETVSLTPTAANVPLI